MTRIQLEISDEKLLELKSLMRDTGITTKKNLLNEAITLFEWAVKQVREGHHLVVIDHNTLRSRELVVPCLEKVRGLGAGR